MIFISLNYTKAITTPQIIEHDNHAKNLHTPYNQIMTIPYF